MLTVVDLFCGAGGLSAGFKAARLPGNPDPQFRIAYGVDHDQDAIETFRAIHFAGVELEQLKIVAPCADIKEVTTASIRTALDKDAEVDILIGGPSCQGVSAAGLRNSEDHRNEMLPAFIQLVKELQPRWFVMENVPGLTHINNRELLCTIFEKFEAISGYRVSGDVLLAADYGVPQLRYRLFIIGTRTNAPIKFPNATHVPHTLNGQSRLPGVEQEYETVWEAIGNLADVEPEIYDVHSAATLRNPAGATIPNHYCIELGELNRSRIHSIPMGNDWRSMSIGLLPERYFATRASDQKGAYGRLSKNWPAYTITNGSYNVTAGPFTHPIYDRALSVRESARLQSFDDQHEFRGRIMSQYRQVGNAVPPRLAEAVAKAILHCDTHGATAQNWGRDGRLSAQLIRASLDNSEKFPVLTPRIVEPSVDRRKAPKPASKPNKRQQNKAQLVSFWETEPRPKCTKIENIQKLRQLAKQAGNYRTAKRARAIEAFLDGVPKDIIVQKANVSEASVKKWIDGFYAEGLDGWRAYHASVDRIVQNSPHLAGDVKNALRKARRTLLKPSQNRDGSQPKHKRLHMNRYLLRLAEHFRDYSVTSLTAEVENVLGYTVGTVYVGDLLAIADVALGVYIHRKRKAGDDLTHLAFNHVEEALKGTEEYSTIDDEEEIGVWPESRL
jgi:DNA (cytosine-5)-methyltransferase 1